MGVDEKALGHKLQLARQRAGLTQQALCQRAGIAYSTLTKIERGAIRSPSIFTVAAIAQATKTSLNELLEGDFGSGSPALPKQRSSSGVSFVYCDINGVLVRFFHHAFVAIAREAGTSSDFVEGAFWQYNDAVCRGDIGIEEFNAKLGHELNLKNFDWRSYYLKSVEPIRSLHTLLAQIAQRYEVGLLTNIMPGLIEMLLTKNLLPKVSYAAVVDSSQVGAIKPEKKIYLAAQKLAGLDPDAILLVDNTKVNVVAAKTHGWQALWFDDYQPARSIERLKKALDL